MVSQMRSTLDFKSPVIMAAPSSALHGLSSVYNRLIRPFSPLYIAVFKFTAAVCFILGVPAPVVKHINRYLPGI
jgi:hypothetical protein